MIMITLSLIERLMRTAQKVERKVEKHAVPEFKAGNSNHTFSVNASNPEEQCAHWPTV
jgi:hypothetical protein